MAITCTLGIATPAGSPHIKKSNLNDSQVEPTAKLSIPAETPQPEAVPIVQFPTDHVQIMQAAGISPSDYAAVDYIVSHESGWSPTATEPDSGAYGECQSLPGDKMSSAGSDWQTNPVTQLKWCSSYALSRYGGWQEAYSAWVAQNWW